MTDQILQKESESGDAHPPKHGQLAAVALWLPVAAISLSATMWFPKLPEVFHLQWFNAVFTASGTTVFVIASLGTCALIAAVVGLIALINAAPALRNALVLTCGIIAGLSAGTWFVLVDLMLTSGDSGQDLGLWSLAVFAAGSYGFVPFVLARSGTSPVPDKLAAGVDLSQSETAAWYSSFTVPAFICLTLVLLAAAGTVAYIATMQPVTGGTPATIVLVLGAAVSLGLSRVRVTADMRGLRVASSVFRVPLASIRLAHIATAYVEYPAPASWGYRAYPGRTTLMLRRGSSLAVQRTNGTVFSVSIPEPARAAALLTTLATR